MPIALIKRYAKARGITIKEAERRHKSCVRKVSARGGVKSPYAVCYASMDEAARKKKKKGGR